MLAKKFEEQVKRTPDKVAVKTVTENFTYRELNRYANGIARQIMALSGSEVVGLLFDHGYDMIAAILGAVKAGKIYVPLSVDYPGNRLSYMLSHSGSSLLLTSPAHEKDAQRLAGEVGIEVLVIDPAEIKVGFMNPEPGKLDGQAEQTKLAYILYTSGSTGRPKGVMQNHINTDYYTRNWVRIFSIRAEERMTLFSSFCHDGSVQDMYSALHTGATLYPLNMKNRDSAIEVSDFLLREQISIWHSVPSLFSYFANTLSGRDHFSHLRYILLGGEPVRQHEVELCRDYFPHCMLANVYGQTESSVSSICLIDPNHRYKKPIIGKPLDKTQVYVIDSKGEPVAELQTGEILVACQHISPGYWENQEATDQVFADDEQFGRLYWTGDLGRLLVNGDIEFMGRRDHQIKIRGFRVEPGEIETQLLKYEAVSEAIVMANDDGGGDKYLTAYIVFSSGESTSVKVSDLRTFLSREVPDYMIPSYFVFLEKMPLTPGGKIDRRALPAPGGVKVEEEYVAPRDDIEERLVMTWSEVLKLEKDKIGIDGDFFQLGGHSLRATIVISRIHKTFDVRLPLAEMFKYPTIRLLAERIRVAEQQKFTAIEPAEKKEYYPLTPMQQRFFLLQQLEPASLAFNLTRPVLLGAGVDKEKLELTFHRLIERHEVLRTSFIMIDGEPVQRVHDWVEFHVDEVVGVGEEREGESELSGIIRGFKRPFNLSQAPLFRVLLLRWKEGSSVLVVDMHHLISDGSSHQVLTRDFVSLYRGERLMDLPLQYKDFSQWMSQNLDSPEMKRHRDYWLERLGGVLPVLNLPTDFPRPVRRRMEGAYYTINLGTGLTGEVNRLARQTGTTVYMVLLAAFNIILSRYSGQYDIMVGSPVAGRNHADLENIIGLLLGAVIMRNFPKPRRVFSDFLEELKLNTLAAYEHQGYPIEELMKQLSWQERPGHDHIIDVSLILQNMFEDVGQNSRLNGPVTGEVKPPVKGVHIPGTSKLDITLYVVEQGGDIWLRFEYSISLFKPGTIEQLGERLATILKQVSRDPGIFISHIDISTDEEKRQLPVGVVEFFPLTHAQKRIYYTERTFPGTACNNVVYTLRFKEELNRELMEQAVDVVLNNHEGMRLRIVEFPYQEEPFQYIMPGPSLNRFHLETRTEGWIETDARVPISMFDYPLYRFAYIRFTNGQTGLYLNFHHMITDGFSVYMLVREIAMVYRALVNGEGVEELSQPSYRDYIVYETQYLKSEQAEKDREFWQQKLLPLPERVELWKPGRVSTGGFKKNPESQAVLLAFPAEIREKMHQYRRENRSSIFKLVLSTLALYISRVTGSSDIVIAGMNHNRNTAEQRRMAGMFVSTFPIRLSVPGEMSFREYVQRNGEELDALLKNHQRYPFDRLLEELRESTGQDVVYLLDVCLIGLPDMGDMPFQLQRQPVGVDTTPLTIHINRNNRDIEGILEMMWQYRVELFTASEIERLHQCLIMILAEALERPTKQLRDIQLLSEQERENILYNFNNMGIVGRYPEDGFVNGYFMESVERYAERVAVMGLGLDVGNSVQISYRELDFLVGRMALQLKEKGVGRETIVGIYVEPSLEMVVGLWAILMAGGAYLPINPENPPQRTAYILLDSQPVLVLAQGDLPIDIPPDYHGEVMDFDLFKGVGEKDKPSYQEHLQETWKMMEPHDAAYIIYTSGSTGRPKGVVVEHRNLTAYLDAFDYEFELGPRDIVIQQASFAFDAFVEELYPVLLNGGKLVIPGREMVKDIDSLSSFILKQNITMITCSPLLLNELNIRRAGGTIRIFISGGDRLKAGYIDQLFESGVDGLVVYNTYGPTESTVCATYYRCRPGGVENVPIGKPIANYWLMILDRYYHPLPVGVPGELCVTGPGITRGYLNNPGLTAEKFLRVNGADEYRLSWIKQEKLGCLEGGFTLYRTGDLASWLTDGNIEFLGRIDRQVKLRGYRIELGEIENRLKLHEYVQHCVVVDRKDASGDIYLCAYIVPTRRSSKEINVKALKEYLSEVLPDYMIPSRFVSIAHIPLTAANKVDVRSLPEPVAVSGKVYLAPRDVLEKKLEEIWERVLGVEKAKIGIVSNFFELGGHSLKATTMIAQVHRELDVQVPLVELFNNPTIQGLSRYIRGAELVRFSAIEPTDKRDYYPLSFAQKRMFILRQIEAGGIGYNMPRVIPLGREIDRERLAQTFKRLIERHESLRTSFHTIDEQPVQHIHEPGSIEFTVQYNEISAAVKVDEAEPELVERLTREFIQPFDLSRAPLLRAGLLKTGDGVYLLLVDMHHIISDGLSLQLLVKDFIALYRGEGLPPLRIQYKDFAVWQQNELQREEIKKQEAFWLAAFSDDIPRVDLPLDYSRPLVQVFEGRKLSIHLTPVEVSVLRTLVADLNGTLYMVLVGVLKLWQAKLSGNEDVVLGTVVAGRRHADLASVIGMFVNTLVLRSQPQSKKIVRQYLYEVKENVLKVFENQDYPFEELVEKIGIERDMSRNPLFDIMFTLQNIGERARVSSRGMAGDLWSPGESRSIMDWNPISKFDLTVFAYEEGEGIRLEFEYCTALFRPGTIQRFIHYFKQVISGMPGSLESPLGELEIISREEKQQILEEFNQTRVAYPKEKTIYELFDDQVRKRPDGIGLVALSNRDERTENDLVYVSYGELAERSEAMAAVLIGKGVGVDGIVGIMGERSLDFIIGILAILKAGGAYLPIDPAQPGERVNFILADSAVRIILTTPGLTRIIKNETVEWIELTGSYEVSTPCMKRVREDNRALAYVIYTSGTTGQPKGTLIEHGALVNLCCWHNRFFGVTVADRATQYASIIFDASVWEIFPYLIMGAMLHIIPEEMKIDIQVLGGYFRTHCITIGFLPTQFCQQFMDYTDEINSLRCLLTGGDKLNRFKETRYRLFNNYGPTENTVVTTSYLVQAGYDNIPIGKPVDNTTIYILSPHYLRLQPVGVMGEICIGGDSLSRGYLNRPLLTAEKYIFKGMPGLSSTADERFTTYPGTKSFTGVQGAAFQRSPLAVGDIPSPIYRSGDLARWLEDGNIQFLGRIDHQVKIRGFRIELAEIEQQLLKSPLVREVVVVAVEENKNLCAYVVATRTEPGVVESLKEMLANQLPDYMRPAYYILMESLPMTVGGKVNRRALPGPGMVSQEVYVAPRDQVERKLALIWVEVLGRRGDEDRVGIDSDFFELGGHSLKATLLVGKIHKEFNVNVPLAVVFTKPTIRGLAAYIKEQSPDIYISIEPVEQKEYYPLSSAQKRLYVLQQMEPGNTSYNMPYMIPLGREPRLEQLEKVFSRLLDRHEMLRTSFVVIDDVPVQYIHDRAKVEIEFYDWQRVEASGGIASIRRGFRRAFDLSRAPLLRAGVVEQQEGEDVYYLLLLDMHHIITDGTSQELLTREFTLLMNDPGVVLPGLRLQYKDYSEWHAGERQKLLLEKQAGYWRREFSDELPVLELPTDFPRPAVQGTEGNLVRFLLNVEETRILKEIASGYDVTLYMVLLAVFNILFGKLSGQEDIILGTPVAARRHSDLQGIVGMMVNTLAIRQYPSGEKTFRSFLKEIKQRTLEAFDNQEYPFEDLVDEIDINRNTSRNPVFDVMLNLLNQSEYSSDLPVIDETMPVIGKHMMATSRFDMSFSAVDSHPYIWFTLEYSTRLWTPGTIERFIGYLKTVIHCLGLSVDQELKDIQVISPVEWEDILRLSSGMQEVIEEPQTVQERFSMKVMEVPDRIALIFNGHHVSYSELNQRANRIAYWLREKGVGPDIVVGLMLERSPEMVMAMLGILKAGGAYLPIDPGYPEQRILSMLNDSGVSFLITHSWLLDRFPVTGFKKSAFIPGERELILTPPRPQVQDFDSIPIPDRTLIDYERYHRFIGEAPAKNTITMQATRGCPYNCIYCHKIWPKTHVARSAEHVYREIMNAYEAGLRRFVFIDDIFNLDKKNSSRLLEKIVTNKLNIQLFFPNGFRADILEKEFIDLMMEAGTVNLDVALESASPRIQKLIRKNLNLDKFKENVQYITKKYPHVILEMEMMHGFPTETEEEALMTLEFLKEFKWVHFPNLHVLKIFPNTDICRLAIESGISEELIERSANLAFHELPDTLPFPKSFTRQFQARFMGEYFLDRKRLLHVLPQQMKVLTEDELIQKYDSYLSSDIRSFEDILQYTGLTREDLGNATLMKEEYFQAPDFREKISVHFPSMTPRPDALRVLLLDLSQLFSEAHEHMLHHQVEEPLGLLYLMSYLNDRFKERVTGRVFKSRIDFDSYDELKGIIEEFQPDVIGIRTLSFYKEFFHKTVTMIRQWGVQVPVISGGPYATSDYSLILQDPDVDLVVMGEGEHTLGEVIEVMLGNGNELPEKKELKNIRGLAFVSGEVAQSVKRRQLVLLDQVNEKLNEFPGCDIQTLGSGENLLYVIYTSGSTGKPKGVMLEQRNFVNLLQFQEKYTDIDFSRVLQFTTISFDVSAQEIFSTLLSGGTLLLVSKETVNDVLTLLRLVGRERLTTMFLPASFLKFIMSEAEFTQFLPGQLRHIVTAGEQVVVNEKLRAYLQGHGVYLHNHYGPSETHVVTTMTLDPGLDIPVLPSIGRPVINTEIYIFDKARQLVPVGVPGELVIGGFQVGRGYLGREDLTAERFILSPYVKGERLYCTGDLARWQMDGNLEFLGRIDQQVKIRGFRIEPGEIENRLMEITEVKEAVVIARDDRSGGKYLCAYVVPVAGQEIDVSRLRESLAGSLPDYMVPAYIVSLDYIPLTPNRKVDRRALPEPGLPVSKHYVGPGTQPQVKLTLLWSEILGVAKERIGIDDNFFELGGHSLKATILTTRIHKAFNVKVPLVEVFKTPTIRELARYIENEAPQEDFIPIEPVEKREYYPMSSAQKRLYILQQMETGLSAYNMLQISVLPTGLDRERLERSLKQLIERHETLRTSFHLVNEEPVQMVHERVDFSIEFYDMSGFANEEEGRQAMGEIINGFVRPYDLAVAPLLRVGLIKPQGESFILIQDLHHIITDGISQNIFVNDVLAFYLGVSLLGLRIQYKDYAVWQQEKAQKERLFHQEKYWYGEFLDEIPVLSLPTDFPRPLVQVFEGKKQRLVLEASLTAGIKKLTSDHEVTLFMVMLSLYTVLLSKLSGQDDIVVGTPVAGREHADLEQIMGMFVNTLALRNRPEGGKTFNGFLGEVRERSLLAFANQDYLFEDLVELLDIQRDTGRNPLFDVMFNLPNMLEPAKTRQETANVKAYEYPRYESKVSKFDMSFICIERVDELSLGMEYSTHLFKDHTMQRFLNYFKNLVTCVLQNPGQALKDIEIMEPEEKRWLLYDFNNITADYPVDKGIYELFENQVERVPDRLALVLHEAGLTYKELDNQSQKLAVRLLEKGVEQGSMVALMPERSLGMIIGILGILRAGSAYLPLDPDYPLERIQFMLEDSGVGLLVTSSESVARDHELPGWSGERLVIDEIVTSPEDVSLMSEFPVPGPQCPAYVIYTSGSTGKPKGVVIQNKSVINHAFVQMDEFRLGEDEHVLQFSSLCFDASVEQIFMTLLRGVTLFLVDKETLLDIEGFEAFIARHGLTHIHAVPSFLNTISLSRSYSLRRIISGGDVCPVPLARRLSEWCDFYNEYGPTETTVTSIQFKVEKINDSMSAIPLGKALTNTRVYVLDRWEKLVPPGIAGELYIGGFGVALGYLNRPELMSERFINLELYHPTEDFKGMGEKILTYKTGDLVRLMDNSYLEFLGRMDQQVKIRGFRIEMGEIEHLLRQHEGIKEAIVSVHTDQSGDRQLCAYVVPHSHYAIGSLKKLRLDHYLSSQVPAYMVPAWIIPLEHLPLTPSGKLDRKNLPEPYFALSNKKTPPCTDTEKTLANLWSDILGIKVEDMDVDNGFFQLGGHSLKATILAGRIHKEFQVKLTLTEIFQNITIRSMASCIKGKKQEKYLSIEPTPGKEFYPVSSAQKRMYILQSLEPNRTDYNTPTFNIWAGKPDLERLEHAFNRLLERHEVFRTSIQLRDNQLVQVIMPEVKIDLEYYEMECENPAEFLKSQEQVNQVTMDFIRPFDLSQPPMIRCRVVRLDDTVHLFMVDMHHIASDGTSNRIAIRDFLALYAGRELPALRLQYKDFAEWQNVLLASGEIKKQEQYWLEQFKEDLPVLTLPLDHPRPAKPDYSADGVQFRITAEWTTKIKVLNAETDTTPYMVILAIYNILLSRYCGQQDIIVGTAVAGRRHLDLQNIVGLFVNMLAMRNKPLEHLSFNEFLVQVKTNALNAYENQDYQFDELVERLGIEPQPGRNALFDTQLTFQNAADTAREKQDETMDVGDTGETRVISISSPKPQQSFDLGFNIFESGDTYRFVFGYLTALFNRSTIENMTGHFLEIMEQCLENREIKLKDIVISIDLQEGQATLSNEDVLGFDF